MTNEYLEVQLLVNGATGNRKFTCASRSTTSPKQAGRVIMIGWKGLPKTPKQAIV